MKYSIIIPVYKVEKYVKQCVNSILSQTYKDYEIILVDDGSPDKCPTICDELAKKNSNIKVIHKANGGLSDARNVGINVARGEYIIFIDSDDYINDVNFLEKLSKISEDDVELIIFGYKKEYESNKRNIEKDKFIEKNNQIIIDLISQNYFKACAWDKVIKREIITKNNISFPIGKYSEDIEWCANILNNINFSKIRVLNENVYTYRQRGDSITKTIKEKNILDMISMIESQYKVEDNYKNKIINSYLAYEFSVVLGLIETQCIKRLDKKIKNRIYNNIKILDFNISKKVKKVRLLKNIFGVKITSKILGIFIDLKG